MLRHVLTHHPNEDMFSVELGMSVRKFCKSSFERQILESVTIQHERNYHHLMNSKSEYNRCSLPRLSTKMGDQEMKEYKIEQEKDKQDEEILEKKIRTLRKELNKSRMHPTKESGPKPKRGRLGLQTT